MHLRRTREVRQHGTTQLFITYGERDKGKPISKHQLSKWLVECIKFAYDKHDLPILEGVKGHHAHKMAVTYANMAGGDPQTICSATTWSNTCMFAKFYWLDAVVNSDAEFGRRVLMIASSSTIVAGIVYAGSLTSVGRVELNSNQDISC